MTYNIKRKGDIIRERGELLGSRICSFIPSKGLPVRNRADSRPQCGVESSPVPWAIKPQFSSRPAHSLLTVEKQLVLYLIACPLPVVNTHVTVSGLFSLRLLSDANRSLCVTSFRILTMGHRHMTQCNTVIKHTRRYLLRSFSRMHVFSGFTFSYSFTSQWVNKVCIRWWFTAARMFDWSWNLLQIFRLTFLGRSTIKRLETYFIVHYLTILSV